MSAQPILFARLAKYDEETGIFEAVATDQSIDKANERFHYATSKPYFEKWSGDITKATGGKSVGNLRVMHSNKVGGIIKMLDFDDSAQQIRMQGQILDPLEREIAAKGGYCGVSIGGSYLKKWDDDANKGVRWYTAVPAEISLVDNPCNPNAHFTMTKADGTSVEVAFAKNTASADEGASPANAATTTDAEPSADVVSKSTAAAESSATPPPPDGATAAVDPDAAEKAAVSELVKLLDARTILPTALYELAKCEVAKAEDAHRAEREAHLKTEAARDDLTNADVEKLAAEFLTADEIAAVAGDGVVKMAGLYAALRAKGDAVAKREFSDKEREKAADSGAALPDGSFPIKTKGDLKNAVQAYGRAKDKAAAKKHIIERAKALGATDELPDGWMSSSEKSAAIADLEKLAVSKGMFNVSMLAQLVDALDILADACAVEAGVEGDESPIPGRLRMACDELGMILCEMCDEETSEMAEKGLFADALQKAGARHSKADLDRLQAIHDHSVGMGAQCATEKATKSSLRKALGMADDVADEAVQKAVDDLKRKAALWDNAPAAPKGAVRAVTKVSDVDPTTVDDPASSAREVEIQEAAKAMVSGDPLQLVKLMHRYGARPGLPPTMTK